MAITLQESLRAIFYAPFYVALARGAFDAEGVEIRFASSPRPQDAAKRLMDGTVDVCWGGPMRVNETYQQMPGCDIVCFGEVVGRDPFLLMGRRPPRDGFTLADLKSVRLAGIDPGSITRVSDQTMARNVEALKAGEVDVIQVFEPFPSLLLADKAAHVWYEAARRGPTSYTTFYARRGKLQARRDELTRMVRAIAATEKWVASASGGEIAAAIASYFTDVPAPILEAACTRYKTLGIWNADPILPRESYDRLRDSLVSGGFVSPGVPFEAAVDNSLADAVLKA